MNWYCALANEHSSRFTYRRHLQKYKFSMLPLLPTETLIFLIGPYIYAFIHF